MYYLKNTNFWMFGFFFFFTFLLWVRISPSSPSGYTR